MQEASATETSPLLGIQTGDPQPQQVSEETKHDIDGDNEQTPTTHDTSTASTAQHTMRSNITGMLCITLGCSLLTSAYAILKYLQNELGVSLFECIIVLHMIEHLIAWALWLSPDWILKKPDYCQTWYGEKEDRLNIWLRGLFYYGDLYFYWYGITIVNLGDAETIYLLTPMFVALAGKVFLKDELSAMFPLILTLAFIGVTVLAQPEWLVDFIHQDILNQSSEDEAYPETRPISVKGFCFLLTGALSWSCMNLMVRGAKKAHWIQFELTTTLQAFAIWSPLLILIDYFTDDIDSPGTWRISWEIMFLFILGAVLCFGALVCFVLGYQMGESTKVCWFEYFAVGFGYLYQITLFENYPTSYEVVGSSIMLSTCFVGIGEEYYHWRKAQGNGDDNAHAVTTAIHTFENIVDDHDTTDTHTNHDSGNADGGEGLSGAETQETH
eukprot:CAMPEP_0197037586 /NCGR_PEP_ID=MMETSP1384-20130603/14753_1 /TAXON_ID=29189 /ORGANISM="Ammonia sp." /LENGTH=440 /DNA_ID=CAMNT_0042467907 /DNA_START=41 /DNA_END=1363 /DNA_ORIENTATION=+